MKYALALVNITGLGVKTFSYLIPDEMKDKIHPDFHPVCFVDVSSGARFVTRSTMKSKQIEKIDGVDCYMITRDVTSDSHPAYTGEKRFVDTAGRVEKFQKKFSRVRSR